MGSLEKLRMRIRILFRRERQPQALDEELKFHLEQLTAEKVAAGLDPVEARQAALRAFGNPISVREQTGDTWAWSRLEMVAHNMRIGARSLSRTPGFAVIAVLIIAMGIGANTALWEQHTF
jgi:hypothetical protein